VGIVMTVPEPNAPAPSGVVRVAIWTAIGALIAAAIVCVLWVLLGPQNGIIGKAFLTILLLAGFAGAALLDTHLAPRRPAWFALASMITWVAILILGALLIWMPGIDYGWRHPRFVAFVLIVLILELALLHVRLYLRAHQRYVTGFTRTVAVITVALVIVLAVMLVLPLAFGEYLIFSSTYWRWVVALAILAALGTVLIPLLNALFAPKKPKPVYTSPYQPYPVGWPTYADGVTPLPVMLDGSPDWTAYYTGYPSTVSQAIAPTAWGPVAPPGGEPYGWAPSVDESPAPEAPAAPGNPGTAPSGYEGYPPRPPLPPRP